VEERDGGGKEEERGVGGDQVTDRRNRPRSRWGYWTGAAAARGRGLRIRITNQHAGHVYSPLQFTAIIWPLLVWASAASRMSFGGVLKVERS